MLEPYSPKGVEKVLAEFKDVMLIPNAALRFTPPQTEESGGSVIGQLLPRPPRSMQRQRTAESTDASQRQVWVLRDGEPQPVTIKVGATDGLFTQVLSGGLEPDMELLIDVVETGDAT